MVETEQRSSAPLDVLCLGETLVDFIAENKSESLAAAQRFRRQLGGSPANLAMQVARLGGRAAIASKVGAGAFGHFCRDELAAAGVETAYVVMDPAVHTTVVFVSRTSGTPDFEVFRAGDAHLRADDISPQAIKRARVAHASLFALTAEPCRTAIADVLFAAASQGKVVSLDPNYHPALWPDRDAALSLLAQLYPRVTLTKPSLDDARRLFGDGHTPQQYLDLFHGLGAVNVVLTMGGDGVWLSTHEGRTFVPPLRFTITNATGAGDAFGAGLLLAYLDGLDLVSCARFGQESARRKLTGANAPLTPTVRATFYAALRRDADLPAGT